MWKIDSRFPQERQVSLRGCRAPQPILNSTATVRNTIQRLCNHWCSFEVGYFKPLYWGSEGCASLGDISHSLSHLPQVTSKAGHENPEMSNPVLSSKASRSKRRGWYEQSHLHRAGQADLCTMMGAAGPTQGIHVKSFWHWGNSGFHIPKQM